jgi:hypothetical protein
MNLNEMLDQKPKNIKCSNPKCNGDAFGIAQQPLNGNGPSIAVVECKNCGQIMGQLEPNSVTTNLGQIHSLMARVSPVLERLETIIRSAGNSNNTGAQEIKSANSGNPNISSKQDAQIQRNQGNINPPATPSEGPESSGPEADQSLE